MTVQSVILLRVYLHAKIVLVVIIVHNVELATIARVALYRIIVLTVSTAITVTSSGDLKAQRNIYLEKLRSKKKM